MSSFVIAKKSFIRVAGLMTGIASVRNLWMYDQEHNRRADGAWYRQKLTACYELNVDSVCKQYAHDGGEGGYGNPKTYEDHEEYMDEFNKYVKIGAKLGDDQKDLEKTVADIRYFARSVAYQIEDEADHMVVMEFFNTLTLAVYDLCKVSDYKAGLWGEFDLERSLANA